MNWPKANKSLGVEEHERLASDVSIASVIWLKTSEINVSPPDSIAGTFALRLVGQTNKHKTRGQYVSRDVSENSNVPLALP